MIRLPNLRPLEEYSKPNRLTEATHQRGLVWFAPGFFMIVAASTIWANHVSPSDRIEAFALGSSFVLVWLRCSVALGRRHARILYDGIVTRANAAATLQDLLNSRIELASAVEWQTGSPAEVAKLKVRAEEIETRIREYHLDEWPRRMLKSSDQPRLPYAG